MLYLVQSLMEDERITLVKADNEESAKEVLIFGENTKVVGRLTDTELRVLDSSAFAVIQV